MGSEVSSEKELFRNIGLLSNEVIQIQKTLHTIDSETSRLSAALDELNLEREILLEQTTRLETIVKQAATSALQDAELESERRQSLESENSDLQAKIIEMEQALQTKETAIKDQGEEFTAKLEELNGRIKEKDGLLQMRDIASTDLRTAAASLNRLLRGLSSNCDAPVLLLDEPQDNPKDDATDMINEIDQRASKEIERLKNDVREKELALAAKSEENEKFKQTMGGRLEELEKALDSKRNKKSPRLVSLLADMGGKRFI